MDEQMRMLIQDSNKREENLKNELHSVKCPEVVLPKKGQSGSTSTCDEILKTHHVPISVTSSEEDLEIAEITRQKTNEKMNDPTQLTPEQVFWSNDLLKQRAEALQANSLPLPILPPATMYPPNTPVHLVPRTLPTTSQVNIALSLGKEVKAMKAVFENMEAEVDQNAIDRKCREIERKNLLITNENLIANCIAHDVFYTVTDSALNASRFHDLSTAYNVAMTRVVELESENSKLLDNIQHDNHDTMVKDFSKLEVAHLNLQLKYQHLKENIENFKSKSSKDVPEFDTFFELGIWDDQIQGHINTIQQLGHFKAENEKIKQHYQELFNSIKVTRVKTIERTTSLQTKIENLKTQLKGKMPCVTSKVVTPKVSAIEKYAIKVESIPATQRNNRDIHHHYLNRLRDTLDTLREIVEHGRSKRPSDNSLEYACVYTKRSQELLGNVHASCPKESNKGDNGIATTPSTRKKHVTFADPLETSNHNTSKQVKQPEVKKTNVPISPSTGVNSDTKASGSKPSSNIKNDRTLPAKSVPKKKVEDHIRNN
ncbi:hypothetical protein Tco_0556926, partial [Tanacetum coccineum]